MPLAQPEVKPVAPLFLAFFPRFISANAQSKAALITRERGHRVCATAVDLRVNELLAVEMFTAWQIAAPRAGGMFLRCGICGGVAQPSA